MSWNAYYNSGQWKYLSTDFATQLYIDYASNLFQINYAASGTTDNALNWVNALTMKDNGNIGIGTTSPAAKLDIRGDLKIVNSGAESSTASFWAQGTGNAGVFFDASNGDGIGSDYGSLLQKDYLGIELTNYGANPIHLLTAGAYRLTVTGSGYVGIGTTSPTEKLSVNGTVLTKKVRVSTAGADWPDFVFAPNYKLRTLNELEAYIKANQYLPEVPSAKEVEENGLDLGKMDATLLQKVEELTLYLIEMNKKVEKLEKENLKLKKAWKINN